MNWLTDITGKLNLSSDKTWDGSASRFSDEQWEKSCILDRGENAGTPKQRFALPIREPEGSINASGVHAAASRLDQVKASAEAKNDAKKRLRAAYKDIGEECPESLELSADEQPVVAVSLSQKLALGKEGADGLIEKVICKTGQLALSPGPGQIDIEKPLKLTSQMFKEIQRSYDEGAVPHVTIPTTHANNTLDNTGFIRGLRIEQDPTDGQDLLIASMEFTDKDVRKKVIDGSVADTSVGVLFNFRNKRSGTRYPAVLEHVALTNQPWVDGLVPFGQDLGLSRDEALDLTEDNFSGVFLSIDDPSIENESEENLEEPAEVVEEGVEPISEEESTQLAMQLLDYQKSTSSGNTLPKAALSGKLPGMAELKTTSDATENIDPSVEQLLASQQAQIEATEARNGDLETQLANQGDQLVSQGKKLHAAEVRERMGEFEHLPPVLQKRIEAVLLGDFGLEDGESLNLSYETDGETEELELSGASAVVDFLFTDLGEIAENPAMLALSAIRQKEANEAKPQSESAVTKADAWERKRHPERFNPDGTKKVA